MNSKKGAKRLIVLLIAVMCVLCLCSCGKKGSKLKDYVGYYTYTSGDNYYTALEISKDGAVIYRVFRDYYVGTTYGTMDVADNKGHFYNTNYEGDSNLNWTNCFPLTLTLINDGKGLYVESDTDTWIPDSYNRVDEELYTAFCTEHKLTDSNE